jgi:transposase
VAFMAFVRWLIVLGWLQEGDVICLDNARIHTGGEAVVLEGLLWNYERDGRRLRILTVFLPTRAPELNPIELVFHIEGLGPTGRKTVAALATTR